MSAQKYVSSVSIKIMLTLIPIVFALLFILRQKGFVDFWWVMSAIIICSMIIILRCDDSYVAEIRGDVKHGWVKNLLLGVGSALVLYAVFALGNYVSRIMFPFSGNEIGTIYGFRDGASDLRIALLMLLVIGPGEELLWRGFFQRRLSMIFGKCTGYIGASCVYAAVHLFTGNVMLVIAALTCGLFWGFIYGRTRSVVAVCVSHTLWDILVFIVFPFARQGLC